MFNKKNLIKAGKFLAKLAIASGALYLVSRQIEPNKIKGLLLGSNLSFILLGLLLFVGAKVLEARRSNIFFRVLDINMSETMNIKLYLLGMFYNLFLPGGIGGDSYRGYWLKKQFQTDLKPLITALLLNRVTGLIALISLLLVSSIYVSEIHYLLSYAYFLIPIIIATYYFGLKRFFPDYTGTVSSTTAYSFFIQALQVASAHFILYALGVEEGFGVYWFAFLISGIAFVIPGPLGGFGSRELVFTYGASVLLLPIDVNSCIALCVIIHIMRAFVSLGGVYYLMNPGRIMDKS